MLLKHISPILALLFRYTVSEPAPNFQENCIALKTKIKSNYTFTVNIAQYLEPNVYIDYAKEGLNATCKDSLAVPIAISVCRLNLRVKTTEKSEVYMEIWLPERWEQGRVLMTGNSALSGCIRYTDIAYGASYGFVTIGTNAGHNGTSGRLFHDNVEVYQDFIWRGIHTASLIGKSIAEQFYKEKTKKSYFIGCSTGGRQGWTAIQRTPALFDGVIAGAPANGWFAHMAWFANALRTLGFTKETPIISAEQWIVVALEVLDQCDGLDGAQDGILEDPAACKFNWTRVTCQAGTSDGSICLTQNQVDVATQLFAPVRYKESTMLSPGHAHGYELDLIANLYTPFIKDLLEQVFRYIVYKDLSWQLPSYTLQDSYNALQANTFGLDSFDGNISEFKKRGGKVLHWHGSSDPLTSVRVSDWYYKTVQSSLKASVADLDPFYRYFRASGVGHCYGGPGANVLGQLGGAVGDNKAEENILMSLVRWVEQGKAPETICGTKFVSDTMSLGVNFKRRHCKYPRVNKYSGNGNWRDENGWRCVEPASSSDAA